MFTHTHAVIYIHNDTYLKVLTKSSTLTVIVTSKMIRVVLLLKWNVNHVNKHGKIFSPRYWHQLCLSSYMTDADLIIYTSVAGMTSRWLYNCIVLRPRPTTNDSVSASFIWIFLIRIRLSFCKFSTIFTFNKARKITDFYTTTTTTIKNLF